MVFGTGGNLHWESELTIDQIPETYAFADHKFNLIGLIGGNHIHFVS